MKEKVTEIFCIVDDFRNTVDENFAEKLLPSGKKPTRTPEITHSEIFTIILLYQVRQF